MKRMTQLMVALAATMTLSIATQAQTVRDCNLGVTLTSPAASQSVPYGDTAWITFDITNNGPDSILAGDTMFYALNGDVLFEQISTGIPSGGTASFDPGYYFLSDTAADLNIELCLLLLNQSDITYNPGNIPALVTYNDNDSTNDESCVSFTLKGSGTTGIVDFKDIEKETLSLYPNPATAEVRFNINLDKTEAVQVSVKDIAGREVMRHDFGRVPANASAPFSLDISRLTPGLYFVELNTGSRKAIGKLTVRQ
jgi:archaellum component FlaG (FlaF/FlaG flagellin family)